MSIKKSKETAQATQATQTFVIFRQQSPEGKPHYDRFKVPIRD